MRKSLLKYMFCFISSVSTSQAAELSIEAASEIGSSIGGRTAALMGLSLSNAPTNLVPEKISRDLKELIKMTEEDEAYLEASPSQRLSTALRRYRAQLRRGEYRTDYIDNLYNSESPNKIIELWADQNNAVAQYLKGVGTYDARKRPEENEGATKYTILSAAQLFLPALEKYKGILVESINLASRARQILMQAPVADTQTLKLEEKISDLEKVGQKVDEYRELIHHPFNFLIEKFSSWDLAPKKIDDDLSVLLNALKVQARGIDKLTSAQKDLSKLLAEKFKATLGFYKDRSSLSLKRSLAYMAIYASLYAAIELNVNFVGAIDEQSPFSNSTSLANGTFAGNSTESGGGAEEVRGPFSQLSSIGYSFFVTGSLGLVSSVCEKIAYNWSWGVVSRCVPLRCAKRIKCCAGLRVRKNLKYNATLLEAAAERLSTLLVVRLAHDIVNHPGKPTFEGLTKKVCARLIEMGRQGRFTGKSIESFFLQAGSAPKLNLEVTQDDLH